MEVTPFPYLNQDEISHLYSTFFPDIMEPESFDANDNNNNLRKRRRKEEEEEEDDNTTVFKDVMASLTMFDDEAKLEEDWGIELEQDKSVFALNSKKKIEVMNDYQFHLQSCNTMSEMDELITKRSRTASAVVAASAVENAVLDVQATSSSRGGGGSGQQRRLWVKDRSKAWWDKCNSPDFPEDEFRQAFRMSKSTFDMLCEELDSVVTKKNTMLRDAIPVRQRVAVCIWRLATGEPLRLVSKRFGLGISTCHKLVLEVCSAIRNVLMPKFLQWPDDMKLKNTKDEFESISGISNIGGAMYTTHIPIIAPKISVAAYFNKRHTERNQKSSYSITLQGVVDTKGIFTDVCIGWPGSMPDDQVLEKSALYQRASKGALNDTWLVGNSGLPLMDWILVPYTHQNLTWTQHAFNEKIGGIENVAKQAFMRLKGRWTCLQKRTEVKLQDLPVLLGACCVLHNICEMQNEEMDSELKFDIFDDEMVPENSLRSVSSIHARDHIAHNLLHHGIAAGPSFF